MNDYPPNWKSIATAIKELSGWTCERCKHPHNVESGQGKGGEREGWNAMKLPQQPSESTRRRNADLYKRTPNPEPTPDGEEETLQAYIAARFKVLGWVAFRGSMAHATFRTPGEPDFVALTPRGGVLLVEAKTRTSKQSTPQLGVAAWAELLGHRVFVVRSELQFEALVAIVENTLVLDYPKTP